MRQPPGERDQQEPGRQRPQGAGEQRTVGRQELGRHRVRGAPGDGSEGGDQQDRRAHPNSLDVKYLDIKRLSLDHLLVKMLDIETMETWHTSTA
ncbi:hypothetical protein Adi01nite_47380 [Amorphoplanes digitatis]|nr:hypothetical protein Adi01nite_47380 [Actinoplanes digitatis]